LIRRTVPDDDPGVVIGDTEADVAAANALGYLSIAVTSGIRDRDILELEHPGYLVDSIGDVEDALRREKLL
jgi:phosphoglycolate phosphatase-like HAD superfamily hydrolase